MLRATSAAPSLRASNGEACACIVPIRARSSSSSTGWLTRAGNVIVGEFGRAAHVDAVGVRRRVASTSTRLPG